VFIPKETNVVELHSITNYNLGFRELDYLVLKFVNVGVFTTKTINVVPLFFVANYNLGFKDFYLFGSSIY
jgi:hypothetical protein